MAGLPGYSHFVRMGVNSDPTAKDGSPSSELYIPIAPDGLSAYGAPNDVDIPTEHKDRGSKYRARVSRNGEAGSLTGPLFPEQAGLILNALLNANADDTPYFHRIERYYGNGSAIGGSGTGRQLNGISPLSLGLQLNREEPAPISFELGFFFREDKELTSAAPTPTWPTLLPYTTPNLLFDVDFTNSAWGPNDAEVLSAALNWNLANTVGGYLPNAVATLDQSWNEVFPGIPTLELTLTLRLSHSDYLALSDTKTPKELRFRVACASGEANAQDVTDANASAAATALSVADETGFAASDYVLVHDQTGGSNNGNFDVVQISGAPSAGNLPVSALLVDVDSGSTVRNTAWMFKIDKAYVTGQVPMSTQGSFKTVQVTAQVALEAGNTSIVGVSAYNDNNS